MHTPVYCNSCQGRAEGFLKAHEVELCPLHAQAPAMLAALRMFFDAYKDHPERLGSGSSAAHQLLTKARAILRAVEG